MVLFANSDALECFETELHSENNEPWRGFLQGKGGLWHDHRGRLWDVSVEESVGPRSRNSLIRMEPALHLGSGSPTSEVDEGPLFVGLAEAAEALRRATSPLEVAHVCARVVRIRFGLPQAGLMTSHRSGWRPLGEPSIKSPEVGEILEECRKRGVSVVWESPSRDIVAVPVLASPTKFTALVAEGIADEARVEALHALAAFAGTMLERNALEDEKRRFADGLQAAHQELLRAYDETVLGWTRALDLRDKITEGHTQRVTELTVKLARRFGFTEKQVISIRRGALLHDIGKVGIPDSILLKDAGLTNDEWDVMRTHTTLAYDMLRPIGFLKDSLDIPHCHHERWDGKGYPQGLKGEQIPLPARVFAVVDVWDALTSDRPYRGAMPHEEAKALILDGSGTQFDPTVVAAFISMLDEELS
ncbi:MAG: HD-GYP domain-containing protein [Fimbriimonadaceae bacterium]|nr:HD-GYP domain-containing protein [Fimbriimonadaceae bacterium]